MIHLVGRVRRPIRRGSVERYLILTLLSFAASAAGTWLFLKATVDPQLGDAELHIAHVLWGGLLLFIAALLPLIYANPWVYDISAILAGVGVGLFIDDVGIFIAQSNDNFYPAAAPIVYATLLLTLLLFFRVRKSVATDSRAELFRALESMGEVLDHDLNPSELSQLRARLERIVTDAQRPAFSQLALQLLEFLDSDELRVMPERMTLSERISARLEVAYYRRIDPVKAYRYGRQAARDLDKPQSGTTELSPSTRRGGEPSEGRRLENETVRRTPHMDVSATDPVPPGEEFYVSVYADQQKARAGERSEDIVVELPEEVIVVEVQAQLLVSPHFKVVENDIGTLTIDRTKAETEKVPFKVQVRSVGELAAEIRNLPSVSRGSITALFHYEGRPSGRVSRIVPVDFPLHIPDVPSIQESPGAPHLHIEARSTQPDLLIEIHADPINDGQQFRCRVSSPLIKEKDRGWVQWNLPSVAEEIVNAHMERFIVDKATPLERLSSLKGAGWDLYNAAPENFKRLFWQLIDSGKQLESIAIVSAEPYIPWELMLPHRRQDGKTQRRKPLGVEFAIGRWTPDNGVSGRQSLALDSSIVIAPKYKRSRALPHAQQEADYVVEKIPGTIIRPAKLEVIDQALGGEKTNVLHFTCHGAESTSVNQVIYLKDDRTLDSSQLFGLEGFQRLFENSNTMVVLNACEVGRPSPALVGVGGFAKAFIDLGASAVVAALWSVKDDIAHEVMLDFYEKAFEDPNRPFADILREIRGRSYESKDDVEDTYAAYCFYGDPLAKRAS